MTDLQAPAWIEQLVSSIPSGVLVLNEEMRVQRANPAIGAIFSIAPQTIIGRELDEVVAIDGLREHALEVLASGNSVDDHRCLWGRGEDDTRRLSISIRAIDGRQSGGGQDALLLLVDDHTEQEELRTRARLSEGGFREVIEHSPDGICVHRNGKFLYINPSLLDLFEVDNAEEIVGVDVYDFVHPEEHADLQHRVRKLLDGAEYVPVRETRLLRSDGSCWTAELTARRVIFEGEPGIVSIARDITERKKLTAQMMQMDRMIAAGTLAAGVGHEINNPLTYVIGNIGFALAGISRIEASLQKPSRRSRDRFSFDGLHTELQGMREALNDAGEGSNRIRDIVSQLRTFSPGEQGAYAPIAIKTVIESVLGMVSNEIRHRAKLVIELDDEPHIYGSENKLGQVFLNLLINAAHAIDEGAYEDNEIRIRTEVDDPWVIVEVCDTGSGIDPEQLSRIFDPFFTTKAVGQGTGLGLYICQRIIEAHGGRIEVESEPGDGTIVRALLPQAVEAEQDAKSIEATMPVPPKGARILVIDDEPMIGRSIARTLEPNHTVTALTSARQALEQLEEGQSFDLILCDLMMPDITGMDFLEQVTERFPHHVDKIAFVTGGAFTPRALEFLEHTDHHCLDKPLDFMELRNLVRNWLERSTLE